MKKLMGWVGLGALSLFLLFWGVQILRADDPASGDNDGPPKMDRGQGWEKGGPMGMWKEKMGLTVDQAAKLKDLMKNQREETRALADQMKVDMDTLKLKVDSKASDDQIKTLLDNLSAQKKKMQAKREEFINQAKGILTPTQQAKFLLAMKEHGRWGHEGGWGKNKEEGCGMGKECPVGMKDKDGMGKHKGHPMKGDDAPGADSNSKESSTPSN
jgi:Spy/CpxP family protein refolding chaperone